MPVSTKRDRKLKRERESEYTNGFCIEVNGKQSASMNTPILASAHTQCSVETELQTLVIAQNDKQTSFIDRKCMILVMFPLS